MKNSVIAATSMIVTLLGSFVLQIIFAQQLSANYLGANGLFTNVVSYLSFAELGLGASIVFSLYKPLAENDWDTSSAIMMFFKKTYRVIGIFILVTGFGISSFLPNLINKSSTIPNVRLMFLLYVFGVSITYFFSYARSLFLATDKMYVNTLNQLFFKVLQYIIQGTLLIALQSYTGYLIAVILLNFAGNYSISKQAKRFFPLINWQTSGKVPSEIMNRFEKNILGNISAKIGTIIVFGTDNILISKFLGLATVGYYSNYALIVQGLQSLMTQVVGGVLPSVGRIGVVGSSDKKEQLYYDVLHVNAMLTFGITVAMYALIPSFISFFFSPAYVLPREVTFVIAINFAVATLRTTNGNFISGFGLFWALRYKSLIESAVNLIMSLGLIMFTNLGLAGVLIGTLISDLVINFWWEPLIVAKYGLKVPLRKLLKISFLYHLEIFVTLFIMYYLLSGLVINNVFGIVLWGVIVGVMSIGLFIVLNVFLPQNKRLFTFIFNLVKKWRN